VNYVVILAGSNREGNNKKRAATAKIFSAMAALFIIILKIIRQPL